MFPDVYGADWHRRVPFHHKKCSTLLFSTLSILHVSFRLGGQQYSMLLWIINSVDNLHCTPFVIAVALRPVADINMNSSPDFQHNVSTANPNDIQVKLHWNSLVIILTTKLNPLATPLHFSILMSVITSVHNDIYIPFMVGVACRWPPFVIGVAFSPVADIQIHSSPDFQPNPQSSQSNWHPSEAAFEFISNHSNVSIMFRFQMTSM